MKNSLCYHRHDMNSKGKKKSVKLNALLIIRGPVQDVAGVTVSSGDYSEAWEKGRKYSLCGVRQYLGRMGVSVRQETERN